MSGVFRKTRLENGVILLTKSSGHTDVVALQAVFSGGARLDPPEQAGLTSLTFSLLLRDTLSRSAAEVADYVEGVGGSIAEEVRKDLAGVSAVCTSQGLPVAVEVLADAILRPAFFSQKVDLEKHNLLMAIGEEEDSPLVGSFKLFEKQIYNGHPYARPVRGEPNTVAALTREDVVSYHARWLRPERLVVACVGNFNEKWLVSAWEESLRDWGSPSGFEVEACPAVGALGESCSARRVREGEATWTVLGFPAPPVGHPDYAPMKVLDCILGGSADSRLFVRVRDRQGLAYVVGTTYLERQDGSAFAAYWGTSSRRQEATLAEVLREVSSMREAAPAEDEVERAKNHLRGAYLIGQETNAGQASLAGWFESLGLGYGYGERYGEQLQRVSPDDVQRVAQQYLGNYALAVTAPRE